MTEPFKFMAESVLTVHLSCMVTFCTQVYENTHTYKPLQRVTSNTKKPLHERFFACARHAVFKFCRVACTRKELQGG